jgi:hypothetical protein
MEFKIKGGVKLIADISVGASMTIVDGSLSAIAAVGGGYGNSGSQGKGLANVDFNAASLSGEIDLEVSVLEVFTFSWCLYAWDGRQMDEVPLLSYNFQTKDTVVTDNFSTGDVPNYGKCTPGSTDPREMCQSSRCVFTPKSETCNRVQGNIAGTPIPNECSPYDMHYICMPVDGFKINEPCSSYPPIGKEGSAATSPNTGMNVNNCQEGLFCYVGTYHNSHECTSVGIAQVVPDSPHWWKSCNDYNNPIGGKGKDCPASAVSMPHTKFDTDLRQWHSVNTGDGYCAHNYCNNNDKFCCCDAGTYYEGSTRKCEPCKGNGAYGSTCQQPLPKDASINMNECKHPKGWTPSCGMYGCRPDALECSAADGCTSFQCASTKCVTWYTAAGLGAVTWHGKCL